MKSLRWTALTVFVLLSLLAGCTKPDLYRYQSFAFGTLIEIKIRDADKTLADETAARLFTNFDRMHKNWHAWQPGLLTQTSQRLAAGEWFTADNRILPLIILSKQYSSVSNGLFNPAIGKLISLWGFHEKKTTQIPPEQDAINSYLTRLPTMDNIEIDGEKIRGRNPLLQLDLGAIAKGYAVEKSIKDLRKQGIENALINAGGDLCGIGNQGKRPWRIGIRNPSGEGILASIELKNNECVFTSGDYERYFDYAGKRYHHIIDPRSGYPANTLSSVTILHSNGAIADAASTALFIAGPENWQTIANNMGVTDVMLIDKQGNITMTPSMQKRIKLEAGNISRKITISKSGT